MKIILFLLVFLSVISISYASVGIASQKDNIGVNQGEVGIFQYEIQTIGLSNPQKCDISLQNKDSLDLSFESYSYIIPPQTRFQIFGTVKTDKNTEIKNYKYSFCITCSDIESNSFQSNKISQEICDIPLSVNILEPQKSIPKKEFPLLLIIFTLILICISFVLSHYKNKNLYRK